MKLKRKLYSYSLENLLVPKNKDLISLRNDKFPKFYIDYLEKINPIISNELEDDDLFCFPFAINFKHSEVNLDDLKVVKNGKIYIACITTDPTSSFDMENSALVYIGEDNSFYERKGLSLFTKFEKIINIKQFLLDEIIGDKSGSIYWDGEEIPESIKKIVNMIKKL